MQHQCEYGDGAQCPRAATHKLILGPVTFWSCNRHRAATANLVALLPGTPKRVELPRPRTTADQARPGWWPGNQEVDHNN